MKKTVIIIPARYSSTRLCGKLLMEVDSKPIIQWVWEAAKKSKLADEIIIATDSELIFNKAKDFGANVEMTSVEHKSGSDRICEVAKRHGEYDYILNMQGDGPQITPEVIDLAYLQTLGRAHSSAVALRILGNGEISKAVTVKASYFSPSAKEKIEKAGGKAELV